MPFIYGKMANVICGGGAVPNYRVDGDGSRDERVQISDEKSTRKQKLHGEGKKKERRRKEEIDGARKDEIEGGTLRRKEGYGRRKEED